MYNKKEHVPRREGTALRNKVLQKRERNIFQDSLHADVIYGALTEIWFQVYSEGYRAYEALKHTRLLNRPAEDVVVLYSTSK
jgi:hypothetical protein